jgi:hypothetical protein
LKGTTCGTDRADEDSVSSSRNVGKALVALCIATTAILRVAGTSIFVNAQLAELLWYGSSDNSAT